MTDVQANKQLVTMARELERKLAARRKVLTKLNRLDDEIRVLRKHVRDLTSPDPVEAYPPEQSHGASQSFLNKASETENPF